MKGCEKKLKQILTVTQLLIMSNVLFQTKDSKVDLLAYVGIEKYWEKPNNMNQYAECYCFISRLIENFLEFAWKLFPV